MVWKTYRPARSCRHLTSAEYVSLAREDFLRRRPRNLQALLRGRYDWMNEYVDGKDDVVELGCGLGLSKEFIRNPRLILTDVGDYPWIDKRVDALSLPFPERSLDALICSHVIHHLDSPRRFFENAARLLKPGGVLLIQELETSPLFKVLMRLMAVEGWDETVDVFAESGCTPDGADPWSANCAVPRLLFESSARFEREFPSLRVERDELCECLAFPLSGGVLAKAPTVPLPTAALRAVARLDELLVQAFPRTLALGRRVVLRRA